MRKIGRCFNVHLSTNFFVRQNVDVLSMDFLGCDLDGRYQVDAILTSFLRTNFLKWKIDTPLMYFLMHFRWVENQSNLEKLSLMGFWKKICSGGFHISFWSVFHAVKIMILWVSLSIYDKIPGISVTYSMTCSSLWKIFFTYKYDLWEEANLFRG